MTESGRTTPTDPQSYTLRDLLLVAQLLHTSGLILPDQVLASDQLGDIAQRWFSHSGTILSRNQNQFPVSEALSAAQLAELYENMLQDNENCKSTTDLANTFYFARIAELEQRIGAAKTSFRSHLERLRT